MIYTDRVHGRQTISEPVILDLINTSAFQRLQDISQAGYSPLYLYLLSLSGIQAATRFEHSLGVFLLLRKYRASLAEQVAGLIHDVAHTVFSHTADFLFNSGSPTAQNYHDKIQKKFVKKTKIPLILAKYHLGVNHILNEENFPLQEKPLPDLCADRLDYSLRNTLEYQVAGQQEVDYFLNNLLVKNNAWVFKNLTSARRYGNLFLRLNTVHYAGFPTAVMFQTMADLLKRGLKKKYLQKKDLFTTEKAVINKLKKHLAQDAQLQVLFRRITPGQTKFHNDPNKYQVRILLKSRIVDPLFQAGQQTKRLSAVDPSWQKVVQKEMLPKEYFLRFEE